MKEVIDYFKGWNEGDNVTLTCDFMMNLDTLIEEFKKNEVKNKLFIDYLEQMWKKTQDIWYIKILQKYKEIIGKVE